MKVPRGPSRARVQRHSQSNCDALSGLAGNLQLSSHGFGSLLHAPQSEMPGPPGCEGFRIDSGSVVRDSQLDRPPRTSKVQVEVGTPGM
jgi:hypothetical protein